MGANGQCGKKKFRDKFDPGVGKNKQKRVKKKKTHEGMGNKAR